MIDKVYDLNIQPALTGINRQNSREKELLIVRVRGQEQKVGLLTRRRPALYPVRNSSFSESVNLVNGGPGRKVEPHCFRRAPKP